MRRMINFLRGTKAVFHTAAIITSAIVSALAAVSMGGDPVAGVAIGAVVNTTVATLTV